MFCLQVPSATVNQVSLKGKFLSERRKRSTLLQGKLYTLEQLPTKQPSYGSKTPDPRDVGSCCCTQKSRPDLVALVALVGADKFNGHAQQPPWHTITFQVDASASISRHTLQEKDCTQRT